MCKSGVVADRYFGPPTMVFPIAQLPFFAVLDLNEVLDFSQDPSVPQMDRLDRWK